MSLAAPTNPRGRLIGSPQSTAWLRRLRANPKWRSATRSSSTRMIGRGGRAGSRPVTPHGWRWGPLEGLLAAILTTVGFVVTFLLIVVGSSPIAVALAAVIAAGSLGVEVYVLSRLP